MKKKNSIKLYKVSAVAFVLIAIIAIYLLSPLKEYLTVDKITEITDEVPSDATSYLIFLGLFAVGGCLLMPMPLAAFAIGLVFPIWIAISLAVLGSALASASGYAVGRFIGLDVFGVWVQTHLNEVKSQLDGKGPYAVFALRIAPTPPFTVTSIISGSMKIHFFKYIVASTAGILPLMLLVLLFGKKMLNALKNPTGITLTSLLAVIILLVVYKIVKKKYQS